MDKRFGELMHAADHLTPGDWDNGFRTQTGQNINMAANGIAKLLRMIEEDDTDAILCDWRVINAAAAETVTVNRVCPQPSLT